jgi:hypothetical protein
MQHSPLPQLLPHVRDQAAVFEDGEDLRGEGGKVIFVTFVDHDPTLEVDLDGIIFFDCVDLFPLGEGCLSLLTGFQ